MSERRNDMESSVDTQVRRNRRSICRSMARTPPLRKHADYDDGDHDFDTGIIAWLQVLGGFFLYFNSW